MNRDNILAWMKEHFFLQKNKQKINPFSKSSSFFLPFSPSLASLYLFEQCLRLGITSTSSVFLPHSRLIALCIPQL